jgi:hypothetical protein
VAGAGPLCRRLLAAFARPCRGLKPVHWSPSSRTALAEAELEYPEGHTSTSVYAAMPITGLGPGAASNTDLAAALEVGSGHRDGLVGSCRRA